MLQLLAPVLDHYFSLAQGGRTEINQIASHFLTDLSVFAGKVPNLHYEVARSHTRGQGEEKKRPITISLLLLLFS